jgi:hypothetical protein
MIMPNYAKSEDAGIMKEDTKLQVQGVTIQNKFYHDSLSRLFSVLIMFIIAEDKFMRRLSRRMKPVKKIFISWIN